MSIEENMKLMKTLDDAWNSQDWKTFSELHANDVIVGWPAQSPTIGINEHKIEGEYFFSAFPDNHIENNPYKIFFGQGDWTCSIANFRGTHKGLMRGLDGKMIPATNKKFEIDFCTFARWKGGRIIEENLFYDTVGMMRQLGLIK